MLVFDRVLGLALQRVYTAMPDRQRPCYLSNIELRKSGVVEGLNRWRKGFDLVSQEVLNLLHASTKVNFVLARYVIRDGGLLVREATQDPPEDEVGIFVAEAASVHNRAAGVEQDIPFATLQIPKAQHYLMAGTDNSQDTGPAQSRDELRVLLHKSCKGHAI